MITTRCSRIFVAPLYSLVIYSRARGIDIREKIISRTVAAFVPFSTERFLGAFSAFFIANLHAKKPFRALCFFDLRNVVFHALIKEHFLRRLLQQLRI